jgi:GDPmannose 4,6-dehydratase
MTDVTNLIRIVQDTQPDEIYNLAAQSHVHVSFETPEYTARTALGLCAFLRLFAFLGWKKGLDFIRLQPRNCMDLFGKPLSARARPSIRARPMRR